MQCLQLSNMKLKRPRKDSRQLHIKHLHCRIYHTKHCSRWNRLRCSRHDPWNLGRALYSVGRKGLYRYDLDYRHRLKEDLELIGGRKDAAGGKLKFQLWKALTYFCSLEKMRVSWPRNVGGLKELRTAQLRGSCLITRKEGGGVNDGAVIQQIACDWNMKTFSLTQKMLIHCVKKCRIKKLLTPISICVYTKNFHKIN